MAAAAIFNFGKMLITPHWIKIYAMHSILQEDASRLCADDHATKSLNRKLICVTSSNERLKHKCIDLGNHCIYFNPIYGSTSKMMRTTYTVLRILHTLNRVTLQLQKRNKTANINVKNCGLYTS